MATFASPAPRRTHRYATPRPSSGTPPRPRRLVGTHRVAPAATPPRSVAESGMEVDEGPTPETHAQPEKASSQKDMVFAKTEELIVQLYGTLPVEVKQALRSTGARCRELTSQFIIFIVRRLPGGLVYGVCRYHLGIYARRVRKDVFRLVACHAQANLSKPNMLHPSMPPSFSQLCKRCISYTASRHCPLPFALH